MSRTVSCGVRAVLFASLTLVALACGCRDAPDPVAVCDVAVSGPVLAVGASSAPGAFYPLDQGLHHAYVGHVEVETGDETPEVISFPEFIDRTIVGSQELFGRQYVLEREDGTDYAFGENTWTYWYRYRQDRSGLYEADVSPLTPPVVATNAVAAEPARQPARQLARPDRRGLWRRIRASVPEEQLPAYRAAWERLNQKLQAVDAAIAALRAGPPGGPASQEIVLLKYPLHPKETWVLRANPLFWCEVESHDVLDLPAGRMPGYRIFVHNEFLDPEDVVRVWYGREGYLKMVQSIESTATDPDGNPIGTVLWNETVVLQAVDFETPER